MGKGHAPGIATGLGVSGARGSTAGWADRDPGAEDRCWTAGFFLAAFFLADFTVGFFLAALFAVDLRRRGFFLAVARAFFLTALFARAFFALAMIAPSLQCKAAAALLTTSR
jgi:hypothetical protein